MVYMQCKTATSNCEIILHVGLQSRNSQTFTLARLYHQICIVKLNGGHQSPVPALVYITSIYSMNFIVFKCQCFKHLNTVAFSQMLLFAVNQKIHLFHICNFLIKNFCQLTARLT